MCPAPVAGRSGELPPSSRANTSLRRTQDQAYKAASGGDGGGGGGGGDGGASHQNNIADPISTNTQTRGQSSSHTRTHLTWHPAADCPTWQAAARADGPESTGWTGCAELVGVSRCELADEAGSGLL